MIYVEPNRICVDFFLNQSENGKYKLISVNLTIIRSQLLYVYK